MADASFCYCDLFSIAIYESPRGTEMVVCVCNAIKEKDLRAAVRSGADRPSQVYALLGRKPKCGQCLAFAQTIIKSEVATA